jgi:hypothetical protein
VEAKDGKSEGGEETNKEGGEDADIDGKSSSRCEHWRLQRKSFHLETAAVQWETCPFQETKTVKSGREKRMETGMEGLTKWAWTGGISLEDERLDWRNFP